jgi:spermidine synthase
VTDRKKRLFQKNTADGGLLEVYGKGPLRWLTLDAVEQTRINIEQPERLASPVQRYFLACLLFIETPEKVLLGGLGGGALARYLYARRPEIQGDAVEINETITALAEDYFYFPKQRWTITVDDLRRWHGRCYDLMIVDIAEGDLTPAWLSSEPMLVQLKQQLSTRGVLAIDLLVNDAQSFAQALAGIRKVFERQTLCLSVPDHKNIIVFAFNRRPVNPSLKELKARVKELTEIWGLEFPVFIEQLKNDNPEGNGFF